jgi:hypothetical protein
MSRHPFLVLAFLPGTLFWVLLVAGIMTGNDTMVGVAIAIAAVTVVTVLTVKIRASSAERAERRRLWREGTPATARVVTLGGKGGSINDHPYVDLDLEVTVADKAPYRASVRALISQLAIPRIQPECRIAVRVDPQDPARLVVDSALTPYGYD